MRLVRRLDTWLWWTLLVEVDGRSLTLALQTLGPIMASEVTNPFNHDNLDAVLALWHNLINVDSFCSPRFKCYITRNCNNCYKYIWQVKIYVINLKLIIIEYFRMIDEPSLDNSNLTWSETSMFHKSATRVL